MKTTVSEITKAQIDFYESNYVPVETLMLNFSQKKYLGSKTNQVCRFCGLSKPDTKFSDKAHALPELIGNKVLFSNYECNICNNKFSRTLEDHFAKYTGLSRTLSQIKGKKGVPSYKSKDKKSRIDYDNDNFSIITSIDNEIASVNKENKKLIINGELQPYNPRSVYKCLVKMALSIMPEDEISNFKNTISWINIENFEDDAIKTNSFVCLHSFTPGRDPFPFITATLLKRKRDDLIVPYMSFFLSFSNYSFQIFIPFTKKDENILGKQIPLEYFPNFYSDNINVKYRIINLSKNEIVKNDMNKMTYKFKNIDIVRYDEKV